VPRDDAPTVISDLAESLGCLGGNAEADLFDPLVCQYLGLIGQVGAPRHVQEESQPMRFVQDLDLVVGAQILVQVQEGDRDPEEDEPDVVQIP